MTTLVVERTPVLIYRETLGAASEPFIAAQAEALQRHEPWYLGLRRAGGYEVPDERDLGWRPSIVDPLRRYAWKRWGASPATVRAMEHLRPTVVHAHFGRDAAQMLPVLCRRRRASVPLVVTFHGHDALRTNESLRHGSFSDRLYLRRWDALVRRGARFLAVSSFVRDRLIERGVPGERVEVHYIGVDSDRIAATTAGLRSDRHLVVFAGRLVEHKGAGDLVSALSSLRRARPDRELRLVVVGDGPDRDELERAAAAGGVDATFVGFQPAETVWAWMALGSVVVVPSKPAPDGRQEAFGLAALEAQAAGTRVVASTCGGLGEAVAPSNRELSFSAGDIESLAAQVDAALASVGTDRSRDAVASAAAWVRAHRDLRAQSARLDDIYDEVSS